MEVPTASPALKTYIARVDGPAVLAVRPFTIVRQPLLLTMKTVLFAGLVLGVLALLSPVDAMALMQPPPPTAPAAVPVDGGLGLLALAGGAYAVKRLRSRRRDEES